MDFLEIDAFSSLRKQKVRAFFQGSQCSGTVLVHGGLKSTDIAAMRFDMSVLTLQCEMSFLPQQTEEDRSCSCRALGCEERTLCWLNRRFSGFLELFIADLF